MGNKIIDAGDHLKIALNGRKKFKIVHSDDATTIIIAGDKRNPEPATAVIKFPGGHIDVSRCSDGGYWAHFQRTLENNEEIGDVAGEIVASRVDYTPEAWANNRNVPPLPDHSEIQHIAVKIGGAA